MKKITFFLYSCFLAIVSHESFSQCPTATVSAGADQTICSSGGATLAGSVGNAISSYTWTAVGGGTFTPNANTLNAVFTPSSTQLTAGSATLTLTTNDPPGLCHAVSDKVVITITPSVSVNAGADQTICAGTTAALAASITGGATTGTWSGGGIFSAGANALINVYTPSASEIAAGSATLTLTSVDPAGPCAAVSDQLVISITTPTVNAGADQTICAGDSVSLSGTKGSGLTSVTWSGGSGLFNPNANSLSCVYVPTAAEVASGSVTLTLTSDTTTCGIGSDQVVVTINTAATVNASVDQTICEGNSVTLSGSVGGSASAGVWSGGTGSFIPSNIPGCTYIPSASEIASGSVALTLTTNDPSGPCPSVNDQMIISINASVTVNAAVDQTVCAGSSVNLSGTISGGITTGVWSGGTGTFSPNANDLNCVYIPSASDITAGTVTLTLSSDDPVGPCDAVSDQMVITILPLPTVSITAGGSTSICQGDAVTLTASAGTTYIWSTAQTTQSISVNTSGNFSVSVSDNNGCSSTATISVTVNPLPSVSISATDTAICPGDVAILTASSCSNYLWSTTDVTQNISVYASGNYSVTVTDTNGCSASTSIAITVYTAPSVSITAGGSTSICQGDSVLLQAGLFSNYLWSTAAITADIYVNTSGNYSVTVTDTNGCSATTSISVTVNPLPTVLITANGQTSICAGDSLQLIASACNGYLWSTAQVTQSIYVHTSGDYSVTVTDANGCSSSTSLSVAVNALPIVDLGLDTTLCYGASITLDAGNGGCGFLWNTAATAQTILASAAGDYYVDVTNSFGCAASDTIHISIANPVVVHLGNDTTIFTCTHGGLSLDAGISGAVYAWNTTAVTQSILVNASGNYYVDVNVGGCLGSDTISVTIVDNTIDLNLGNDTTVCGCIQLNAYTSAATYQWCNGSTYSTVNACQSGTYCVLVDNGMCQASDSISIIVSVPPVVNLGNDTTILSGSLVLDAGNAGANFAWSTGASVQTITVTTSGTYYVVVTNQNGCTAADTIIVNLINGVKELYANSFAASVFPNPAVDKNFTIHFEMPETGNVEIQLLNQIGSVVYLEKNDRFKGVFHKNLMCQHLSSGLYFVEVIRNGHKSVSKITID